MHRILLGGLRNAVGLRIQACVPNLHLLEFFACGCLQAYCSKVSCQWMISQSSSPCAGSAPQIHMSMQCMLYVQIWKRYLLNLPISQLGSHCPDYSHSPEGHARQCMACNGQEVPNVTPLPVLQGADQMMHAWWEGEELYAFSRPGQTCFVLLAKNNFCSSWRMISFWHLKLLNRLVFHHFILIEQSQVGLTPQNMLLPRTYHLGDPYYPCIQQENVSQTSRQHQELTWHTVSVMNQQIYIYICFCCMFSDNLTIASWSLHPLFLLSPLFTFKQHQEAMDKVWGKPGAGAPNPDGPKKKKLDNILYLPRNQVGRQTGNTT